MGALQVAWLALGVRVTLQGWRDRWESAQEEARQRDVRRAECRARWLQGHPELAARAVQVKQMRGGMSEEERGEWLRSSRLLREWGWSSRWDGPGCGWGWEEAAGGGYSIMQAQAEARGREQALARGGSGGPLRARVEGNAQVTLAQAQAQARALVVAQAVAQAGEHTDRLYQAQTWAQARGQAECRRVMADRTRAQIQAKAQGMTVSQGQVAGQGYTVAQAKVSMHMVGVASKVETMVAEQGGWRQPRCRMS